MRNILDGTLGARRAQLPLAAVTLLIAGALIVGNLVNSSAMGGPLGFVIAALLILNAVVRIALRR